MIKKNAIFALQTNELSHRHRHRHDLFQSKSHQQIGIIGSVALANCFFPPPSKIKSNGNLAISTFLHVIE